MLIRSLVTVATVALASPMVHANTGPRANVGGGGGGTRTVVALSAATTSAVRGALPSNVNLSGVINGAISNFAGNTGFSAARVVAAVQDAAVAIRSKIPVNTELTNDQKDGVVAALTFAAITAAAGDSAYTLKVHQFLANGVASTIAAGVDTNGELTNARAFLKALNPNSSMDPDALKRFVDGLVHQMLRNPANPDVRLTGLEDEAFRPSDCFGNRAG